MARLQGKPLNQYNQADMEALEERIETEALHRHLTEIYGGEDDDD